MSITSSQLLLHNSRAGSKYTLRVRKHCNFKSRNFKRDCLIVALFIIFVCCRTAHSFIIVTYLRPVNDKSSSSDIDFHSKKIWCVKDRELYSLPLHLFSWMTFCMLFNHRVYITLMFILRHIIDDGIISFSSFGTYNWFKHSVCNLS